MILLHVRRFDLDRVTLVPGPRLTRSRIATLVASRAQGRTFRSISYRSFHVRPAVPIGIAFAFLALGCLDTARTARTPATVRPTPDACGGGLLRVHFYDVGEGLAALVVLPDDRHILIDAGPDPSRPDCDKDCRDAARRLTEHLATDLSVTRAR